MKLRILFLAATIAISANLRAQTEGEDVSDQIANKMNEALSAMMGGKTKVEPAYTFKHSMRMKVTVTEKNGKKSSSTAWKFCANPETNVMGMQDAEIDGEPQPQKSFMILDMGNNTMVTLMEDKNGQRSGMAIPFNASAMQAMVTDSGSLPEDGLETSNTTFKKTGRTREIEGYTCVEYAFDSKDAEGTAWFAEDAEINSVGFFGMLAKGMPNSKGKNPLGDMADYPAGLILELTTRDKKSNDTVKMETSELALNQDLTVSTTEYKVTSMSDMMGR